MAQPLNHAQADMHIIKQRPLKSIDIACLVINKMIGTGIFVTPPLVLSLVGTKWVAWLVWILGSIHSFCRCAVLKRLLRFLQSG
jgi:hypothetical protein